MWLHEGHRSADRLSTITSFGRQSADNRSIIISSADNRPSSNGIFYKMSIDSRPMLVKSQTGYTRFKFLGEMQKVDVKVRGSLKMLLTTCMCICYVLP